MLLDAKQSRRFCKLYYSLIVYANARLHVSDHLIDNYGEINDNEAFKVCRALWETDDSLSVIDDFVAANPDRLSRTDLREVSQWKAGVLDHYAVARSGSDVCFLYGDHALAVRGITREVDTMLHRCPGFVETALLPFDGVITYAMSISEVPVDPGPQILSSIEDGLREAQESRHIIRGARDFVAKMPGLVEQRLADDAAEFARQAELDMNADEQGPHMHRGPLAGLVGDEREQAVMAYVQQTRLDRSDVLRIARACCDKGRPVDTLFETYLQRSKSKLQDMARALGVRGSVSSMNKRQLAQSVMDASAHDKETYLYSMRQHGVWAVKAARQLVEAGGRIELAEADYVSRDQLPEPMFPISMRYHVGKTFVCVMPEEVLCELADTNWDAELARADLLERLLDFICLLVDLRGIVFIDELVEEVLDRFAEEASSGALKPDDVIDTLQFCSGIPESTFVLETYDDMPVLVHCALDDTAASLDELGHIVAQLIARQRGKRPRPVTDDLLEAGSVEKWVFAKPEAQALMSYLDEHVPDGADDWFFAEEFVGQLVAGFQDDFNPVDVLRDVMEDLEFVPTEAQLKRVAMLAMDLANATPKWCNNGWAPKARDAMRA